MTKFQLRNFCEKLSKSDLDGTSFRVLFSIINDVSFEYPESFFLIQQSEIAKKLNIQSTNISRAIKKLVDRGILIKGNKIGGIYSYKVQWTEPILPSVVN